MQRMSVVLPQPLEPAINMTCPGWMEKLICAIAGSDRRLYWKVRFSTMRGRVSVINNLSNNLSRYYLHLIANLGADDLGGAAIDDCKLDEVFTIHQGHQLTGLFMAVRSHQAVYFTCAQGEDD